MRRNIYFYLIYILIITTIFRGIINNFILINNGTLIVDICIVAIIFFTFTCKRIRVNNLIWHYVALILICIIDLLIQLLLERTNFRDGILGFRNDIAYTFPFLFVFICVNRNDLYKIYSLIRNSAFIINIFAICQFVFRTILPDRFLVLSGEPTFGFWESDVIRVTGLMGNTIVYGGFVVLILSFVWAEIIVNGFKGLWLWLQLIVAVIANLFTFSRASIVGMVIIMLLEYLLSISRNKLAALKRYTVLILFSAIAIALIFNYASNSIIIRRLFGENVIWNMGSDAGHISMIENAITNINKYPIIGYGIGSVGYSALGGGRNIITDGTFWMYLLEWGIPICLVYLIMVLRTIYVAFKNRQNSNNFLSFISLGYIGTNFYLIGASIINSAYSARCIVIILWIFAGILIKEAGQRNIYR